MWILHRLLLQEQSDLGLHYLHKMLNILTDDKTDDVCCEGYCKGYMNFIYRILVLDKGQVKEFDAPGVLLKDKKSIFYGMAKDAGLV